MAPGENEFDTPALTHKKYVFLLKLHSSGKAFSFFMNVGDCVIKVNWREKEGGHRKTDELRGR